MTFQTHLLFITKQIEPFIFHNFVLGFFKVADTSCDTQCVWTQCTYVLMLSNIFSIDSGGKWKFTFSLKRSLISSHKPGPVIQSLSNFCISYIMRYRWRLSCLHSDGVALQAMLHRPNSYRKSKIQCFCTNCSVLAKRLLQVTAGARSTINSWQHILYDTNIYVRVQCSSVVSEDTDHTSGAQMTFLGYVICR